VRDPRTSRRRRGGVVLSALAAAVLLSFLPATAASAVAASPVPTIVGGGDTRSEGEGAGLVGSPFLAAAAVVGLGLVTAGATLLWLRFTRDE
jgi:hypothetical protein